MSISEKEVVAQMVNWTTLHHMSVCGHNHSASLLLLVDFQQTWEFQVFYRTRTSVLDSMDHYLADLHVTQWWFWSTLLQTALLMFGCERKFLVCQKDMQCHTSNCRLARHTFMLLCTFLVAFQGLSRVLPSSHIVWSRNTHIQLQLLLGVSGKYKNSFLELRFTFIQGGNREPWFHLSSHSLETLYESSPGLAGEDHWIKSASLPIRLKLLMYSQNSIVPMPILQCEEGR